MQSISQKRKAFSPLNFTHGSNKIAKLEESSLEIKKESTEHKIKTFSKCSPATLNYLKHNWDTDAEKENSITYCSRNIFNTSGNVDEIPDRKIIKFIPDCSPLTQQMGTNHRIEYIEPQEEIGLLTCSINSNATTPDLKIADNRQFFNFSDDDHNDFQSLEQEKNKENVYFYFDSNAIKDTTSPLLCSIPSNLPDDDFDRETLLLSGLTPLNVSQQSHLTDNTLKLEQSPSQEESELEFKKNLYLLSNVCSEYDKYDDKILCTPKIIIYKSKNNLKTINEDEMQQLILRNIAFLEEDFIA